MGTAVHLVFAARSLPREASNSVFAPSSPLLCPDFSLHPLSSQTCTWGMGQQPQEPSRIVQHVEELGHSNRLSGHWMAPKGLVSMDRTTQDPVNPVSEGHRPHYLLTPRPAGPAEGGWWSHTRARRSPRHP